MTGDCQACAGHGDVNGAHVCLVCGGTGTVPGYMPPLDFHVTVNGKPVPMKKALPDRPRTLETDLVKLFLARIPFVIPHARGWRRNVVDDFSVRGHRILAGIEGQADVYVYAKPGIVVEVEAKVAKGRMRDAQIAWAACCKMLGIRHIVVRAFAGEEATVTVDRWVEELRRVIG